MNFSAGNNAKTKNSTQKSAAISTKPSATALARGEAPEEARANALREFGNVGLVKEVTREV